MPSVLIFNQQAFISWILYISRHQSKLLILYAYIGIFWNGANRVPLFSSAAWGRLTIHFVWRMRPAGPVCAQFLWRATRLSFLTRAEGRGISNGAKCRV